MPDLRGVVERVPWAEGKGHLTTSYRWFLARWAKRLSWTDTAVVVEGFNGKAKLTTRKAYGFRTPQGIESAMLQ